MAASLAFMGSNVPEAGTNTEETGLDSVIWRLVLRLHDGLQHAPHRVAHGKRNGSPNEELQPYWKVFHVYLLGRQRALPDLELK